MTKASSQRWTLSPESLAAWGVLLLFAITIALFAGNWQAPFIYDDVLKIAENLDIRRLDRLHQTLIYPYDALTAGLRNDPSRPLTYLIYALCYAWAGVEPWTYHLVSTVLHAGTGAILFGLAYKLLRPVWPAQAFLAAWCSALLFIVLPIQAGTVLYAYGLSDVLVAFLTLASLLVLLPEGSLPSWRMILGLVLYVLALAAKQSALVLPVLYLLLLGLHEGTGDFSMLRYYWRRWLPLLLLSAAYLVARWFYFGAFGDLEGAGQVFSRAAYASVQGVVLWQYLWLTWLAQGLCLDHYVRPEDYSVLVRSVAWLAWAVVSASAYWSWSRRGAALPRFAAAAVLLFLAALAPTSSLLPTVDILVERRVYLANFGVCLGAAAAIATCFHAADSSLQHQASRSFALTLALTGIALAYLAQTRHREGVYRSAVTLWREAWQEYPANIRAQINLATALLDEHRCEEAIDVLKPFLAKHPEHAPAHVKLAMAYQDKDCPSRDAATAYGEYQQAMALAPKDFIAVFNAAVLMTEQGEWDEAEKLFTRSLTLQPKLIYAYQGLGEIALRRSQWAQAQAAFAAALRIDPAFQPALAQLAAMQSNGVKGP